jgi:hypothetical protein
VGSNPSQGMDISCLCVCVRVRVCAHALFCVCVQAEALRRADHPPKESYRMSKIVNHSETESFMEVGQGPIGAVAPKEKNTFSAAVGFKI